MRPRAARDAGVSRRRSSVVVLAAIVVAVGATPTPAASPRPAANVTPSCLRDLARSAACQLVLEFFGSVNARQYTRACSLLGESLLLETGGSNCPSWLAMSGPRRIRIVRARTTHAGVRVLVQVSLHELDHVRLLRWWAFVGNEVGRLRILETQRG